MSKSHIEIARQLQQNSKEIREYFEELYKWQSELKKQKEIKKQDEEKKKQNNTIKPSIDKTKEVTTTYVKNNDFDSRFDCEKKQRNNKLKRDCNSVDAYYRAWDTLDIDNLNEENVTDENHIEPTNTISCEYSLVQKENKFIKEEKKCNDTVDYEIKGSEVEKRQNENIVCSYPKSYEIYMSKNEEIKILFKNKEYSKCLECSNDIINYIDYDLGNNNIFSEIEKNWENELYIDIISNNYSFDKKTEELFILRTKGLINRSLIYQKLYSFSESIQDCSSVILFYQYFLPNKIYLEKYSISNLFTANIKNIIFKSYYLRGTARYKLKIYKFSLEDFKKSKELVTKEKTDSNLANVNKSIQIIENLINENKVKKHLRRQHEYTATLIEQFRLKPRPLEIEFIPRRPMQQLSPWTTKEEMENEKQTSNEIYTNKNNEKKKKTKKKDTHRNRENDKNKKTKDTNTKENFYVACKNGNEEKQKKEEIDDRNIEENIFVEEKKRENEKNEKTFLNDTANFDSDSSLTLSGDSILTDIEETKPILLINSNKKQKNQIKNKINFELMWNSNKIKKSYREQIALLKTAFIDEGIFTFSSDKDMFVDILDDLIKNKFLNVFEKDSSGDLLKNAIQMHCHQSDTGKNDDIENEKKIEVNILTLDEYVLVIDILYCMTNFGKDNFLFLFIDNKERSVFINFFDFVLREANIFLCNENDIKQKTNLMKKLLKIEK